MKNTASGKKDKVKGSAKHCKERGAGARCARG